MSTHMQHGVSARDWRKHDHEATFPRAFRPPRDTRDIDRAVSGVKAGGDAERDTRDRQEGGEKHSGRRADEYKRCDRNDDSENERQTELMAGERAANDDQPRVPCTSAGGLSLPLLAPHHTKHARATGNDRNKDDQGRQYASTYIATHIHANTYQRRAQLLRFPSHRFTNFSENFLGFGGVTVSLGRRGSAPSRVNRLRSNWPAVRRCCATQRETTTRERQDVQEPKRMRIGEGEPRAARARETARTRSLRWRINWENDDRRRRGRVNNQITSPQTAAPHSLCGDHAHG